MYLSIESTILTNKNENNIFSLKKAYYVEYDYQSDDFKICRHFKLSIEQYQNIVKKYNGILVHSIINEEYYGREYSYNSYFYDKNDCNNFIQHLIEILESFKIINKLI